MILRVKCYAGRKADERPVRFQLGEREYVVEEIPTSGTARTKPFTRSAPTMATSIFCATKWRQTSGDWNRSGGSVSSIHPAYFFAASARSRAQCFWRRRRLPFCQPHLRRRLRVGVRWWRRSRCGFSSDSRPPALLGLSHAASASSTDLPPLATWHFRPAV